MEKLFFLKNLCMLLILSFGITIISCSESKITEPKYFHQELNYILDDLNSKRINSYSLDYERKPQKMFIQFIDGQCQLCALDLKEVDNIYSMNFEGKDIIPLVFIYGEIDPYINDLINKKDIFRYPIFFLDYHSYNSLYDKFRLVNSSYLIEEDSKILFSGNPLRSEIHLENLSKIVSDI